MELCKPTIVVIAYNRAEAVKRLLNSLNNASYPEDVRLIISIDKSDTDEVGNLADIFEWKYGEKIVIKHEARMGLKAHVISCGDLTEKYGSIIMLEDDLYVSKGFYTYAMKALDFVKDDDKIAGISLYNHLFNVHVREPFEAVNDGYDNWYFQFASSWGQIFSKKHWQGFKEHLRLHGDEDVKADNMPANVSSWSDKSWLKHYIKYMIDNDLYFLYPRVSLTTNFMEEGTHATAICDDLQVSLLCTDKSSWDFCDLNKSGAVYDAFFENKKLCDADTCVDLYGYKKIAGNLENKYKNLLSSNAYPYAVIKSYGRHLRPVDMNILEDISGDDFYLYDLSVSGNPPKVNPVQKLLYNFKAFKSSYGIEIIKYRLRQRMSKK